MCLNMLKERKESRYLFLPVPSAVVTAPAFLNFFFAESDVHMSVTPSGASSLAKLYMDPVVLLKLSLYSSKLYMGITTSRKSVSSTTVLLIESLQFVKGAQFLKAILCQRLAFGIPVNELLCR